MAIRLPSEQLRLLKIDCAGRDNWKCRNCGHRNNLHGHHLVYLSRGGSDITANIITLCFVCHEKVHRGEIILFGNADEKVWVLIPNLGFGLKLEYEI
jgi:5-methylcytosine-specific restriction endonuclease McrA